MEKNQSSSETSRNPLQPVMEFLQGGDPEVICTRYGLSRAELDRRVNDYQASRRQMALADHLSVKSVGRNEPCPCGSGKKYKKCCLAKHEEARKMLPTDQLQEMEEKARLREKLEKEIGSGFDLLFSQEFGKAVRLAERLLASYPDDDRLHDIIVTAALATGDYDTAFHTCRRRWQVAQEEKAYFQENGIHKRQGPDGKQLVHFYSPSTWLDKFWIAQRARTYMSFFPLQGDSTLQKLADGLKAANDTKRFPERQEEGYAMRRQALEPLLSELESAGERAIPYVLPLTYSFSWASLFVPDLLRACGTASSVRLLAELSMFRFPYFSQKCLTHLEALGEQAISHIAAVIEENHAFDELKVGLITVLGNVETPESFAILTRLTEHENPYVVNWAAQALGRHRNPEALPYLEKAKARLGALSKIAGAIQDIVRADQS